MAAKPDPRFRADPPPRTSDAGSRILTETARAVRNLEDPDERVDRMRAAAERANAASGEPE